MDDDMPLPDEALLEELVLANHILYKHGIVDGFGHVSARHDKSSGHFLLSRSKAPALVSREDILVHDLDGDTVPQAGIQTYFERFIHSEIYRARPDVMSIVHSHSHGTIVFGITGQRLRPVCHVSGFLGSGSTLFEIHDEVGDSDLLVSNKTLGHALACNLGLQSCALMRGHGMTVVARSVPEAVYRSIYVEVNAQLQLQAASLGSIRFLTEGEARMTVETISPQINRAWDLWVKELS